LLILRFAFWRLLSLHWRFWRYLPGQSVPIGKIWALVDGLLTIRPFCWICDRGSFRIIWVGWSVCCWRRAPFLRSWVWRWSLCLPIVTGWSRDVFV
jgi:hypothetical protein